MKKLFNFNFRFFRNHNHINFSCVILGNCVMICFPIINVQMKKMSNIFECKYINIVRFLFSAIVSCFVFLFWMYKTNFNYPIPPDDSPTQPDFLPRHSDKLARWCEIRKIFRSTLITSIQRHRHSVPRPSQARPSHM